MKELPKRCNEIVTYFLTNPNAKQHEIAKHFGITQGRVSTVLRSPAVVQHYPILQRRMLQSHFAPKAFKALEELVDQKVNLQVREKVVTKILTETKVFDAPDLRVEHSIELKPLNELQTIVRKAQIAPDSVVEGEVIREEQE